MPVPAAALGAAIHLSYPLSFLAGLVSFGSPCVFPLVPAYIGYLGGRVGATAEPAPFDEERGPSARVVPQPCRREKPVDAPGTVPVLANGIAFVSGFSAVFIAAFYILTALDVAFLATHRREVNAVAGGFVLALGLQTIGLFRLQSLLRERRRLVAPRRPGLVPSFLLGTSFSLGWTPCIGPQLAAILRVAQQGDFAGVPVMVSYCLGLAIPFLLLAAFADRLQGSIRALNRRLGAVNLVAGGLLIVVAVLLMMDSATILNHWVPQSPFGL